MTNPLLFIGASLLLATKNASAFQSTPTPLSSTIHQSSAQSFNNNKQRIGHTIGSISSLHESPSPRDRFQQLYDDDDDDADDSGYEIRSNDANGSPRPETTFGAENVPIDQRPSNEYLNLMRQPTFGWASQESGDVGLALRLAVIYVGFFVLVCYPISGATWIEEGFLLQKITASNVGALSVVFVLVVRIYSGWGYIGSRLQSKVIEYEESGWYDGDFEQKSDAEKARDLFLYRSNVKPVEERLKTFALVVGGAWVASCLALNLATSSNPIFNQYDAKMLEKLSYDDKVASTVQMQSNGRPTYCENRYYRAVANGGQGCNKY